MPADAPPPPAGLCADCLYAREIRSDRGAVFLQCLKSREDPRMPKYPRLPVLKCDAYLAKCTR